MPSEEQTQNQQTSSTIVQPSDQPAATSDNQTSSTPIADDMKRSLASVMNEVSSRITEANNILIALSSDPSVDDLAAAIGFSLYLDRIGKRATAIYSGTTPNALEFLNPEETFESTADTLQDFVIALDKDKADHLRYKLDGDFVKIYITPYKKRISESDLDYSYGDYNVDLVLAMDVNNGVDLDTALREYGRIMHDATVINITNGNPGRFGEIEWSDKSSSSVSEMISKLLYTGEEENPLEKEEATAFLTGIVAATDRFSKANTSPETMQIASKLMRSGANQQLIAKNITSDINNELSRYSAVKAEADSEALAEADREAREEEAEAKEIAPAVSAENSPELEIKHEDESINPIESIEQEVKEETKETVTEPEIILEEKPNEDGQDQSLLADLKAAEASLAGAAAETTEEVGNEPVRIEESSNPDEKILAPSSDFLTETSNENPNKFGEMLEEALAEATPAPETVPETAPEPAPATTPAPEATPIPEPVTNPALSAAPVAPSAPEVNGIPEMNFGSPVDELLPPPPVPPVDMNNPLPAPEIDLSTPLPAGNEPAPAVVVQPEAPAAQSFGVPQPVPQPTDAPSAFQIPGM